MNYSVVDLNSLPIVEFHTIMLSVDRRVHVHLDRSFSFLEEIADLAEAMIPVFHARIRDPESLTSSNILVTS